MFYDDSNPRLYKDVLERVDFRDPENSILLRKPTSLTHGGGVRIDRDTLEGRETYNVILNWIMEGAPCGDDPLYCN